MRCEVIAVGTELLLGHVVDTNSAWLGQRLAEAGIDCHVQTRVGDNRDRIAAALRAALVRSEAVIVCGGLGPTPDDITRESVAQVTGAALERDDELVARIRAIFDARGRQMSPSNERQAYVPRGAEVIPQTMGTAPGLVCTVGERVVYAVPGVPAEMAEMVERAVIPDLRARAARSGNTATIVSRVLLTWGMPESSLAEALSPRLAALDHRAGELTMAFVAAEMEGVKVRLTAKAGSDAAARVLLDAEEREVRSLLGTRVFGADDETMEAVIGSLLGRRGLSLGLAESLTGGLLASRLVGVPGASAWFRGSVVAYDAGVKHGVLGVPVGPVVSEEAAAAMAEGAARVLGADVGLGITGVAGPDPQEGVAPGTVFMGLRVGPSTRTARFLLPGDRERVRQHAALSALDVLRRDLSERSAGPGP
ncbi:MAG: competence/damage-inducible protein A [Actinomycetota bacterium]|nr:competence/damage-inducible protein A [Actinomycetota bacterium]